MTIPNIFRRATFWLILALILSLGGVAYLWDANAKNEEEIGRLEGNQQTLLGQVEYYEAENGKLVASVQALTMKRDEFSELLQAEKRVVKDLGIRIKELESMGQTSTDTDVEIEAPIVKPDTIIIHEPIAGTFEWEDAWVRVSGEVHPDMIRARINITDTITIVAHRKARQWLFFRCKGKIVRYDALSSNPHTSITDIRYVELTE